MSYKNKINRRVDPGGFYTYIGRCRKQSQIASLHIYTFAHLTSHLAGQLGSYGRGENPTCEASIRAFHVDKTFFYFYHCLMADQCFR